MSEARRLFFGVGVGTYDNPAAFAPLKAAEEVGEVAQVLAGYGYAVTPSPPHPGLADANQLLDDLMRRRSRRAAAWWCSGRAMGRSPRRVACIW